MLPFIFYLNFISVILSSIVCGDIVNGEKYLAKSAIMSIFSPTSLYPGPCKYVPATRKQNHQCRKDVGLPRAINDASQLAVTQCAEQFRYDRWNCSVETRGKRNIFKKLYKETAFVHALTAAAMTHSVTRACSEGQMTKCSCGTGRTPQRITPMAWRWGECNDNLKHGKRVTRVFLELQGKQQGDQVAEMLRHNAEVGIQAVSTTMGDKCKCHGISGSCSMKTCWRKLSNFNITAELLRKKYYQAVRKSASNRTSRKKISKVRKYKRKKLSAYTTLLYLETSPTFCAVTKGRRCLHPDNCSSLCCGRGYTTFIERYVEKCRCRFKERGSFQVTCDTCKRIEDRYFCK